MAGNAERTFIMVKPDGVHRGVVGEIIKRFEQKGYKLVALKYIWAGEDLLKVHYEELKDKPFYPKLVKYMSSGPLVPMVWEGKKVVEVGRQILGATDPLKSNPGTIRGDFGIDLGRNICHGSDCVSGAEREIKLWFKDEELVNWTLASHDWIYE